MFQEHLRADLCSNFGNIPGISHMLDPALRPESHMQNISGIFQKLLHKSAAAHGQNTPRDILLYAAIFYVFVPFLYGMFQEYFAG